MSKRRATIAKRLVEAQQTAAMLTTFNEVDMTAVMVLRERSWAYPAFMIALALLITYQSYQLALAFSPWLAALTLFDFAILWMTWHEYRFHRSSG